jgi:hypothetical protein
MAMRWLQLTVCGALLTIASASPRAADSTLRTDSEGGLYFADPPPPLSTIRAVALTPPSTNFLPVSPFPTKLVFHSRPGAANLLYLNFAGEVLSNSVWNVEVARPEIIATAFSLDADFTTFNDAEQLAIKRVWERVAEDYAPFNLDVTTERPAKFSARTAHALITKNIDANGLANPTPAAGGLSHVNVFNMPEFARERPVWIYFNNLGGDASFIAEAVSHEIGHTMGLSHDGTTHSEYYAGHGGGNISWAPIMGTAYNQNVTQWSKGDYYDANNFEDDLATIAAKLTYAPDDHSNSYISATPLVIDGTNIVSTKGIIEQNTDIDFFTFATGAGQVRINLDPWTSSSGTHGNNLDAQVELLRDDGALLARVDSPTNCGAAIQINLPQGFYYLVISGVGVGNPLATTPSGYSRYGSLGQYFISGSVAGLNGVTSAPEFQNILEPDVAECRIVLNYDASIDPGSLDSHDLQIVGPNGYNQSGELRSVDGLVATYAAVPSNGGSWTSAENGIYQVILQADQVSNLPRTILGTFKVNVPPNTIPTFELKASVNNAPWGSVKFSQPSYPAGTVVDVAASPALYYKFTRWSGDLAGGYNPISLLMDANKTVSATFAEILTAHHPTPLWWLAQFGPTNNFELTVDSIGANGVPLWQSYVAGLVPSDPRSQFRLTSAISPAGYVVLNWSTAPDRLYTLQAAPDPAGPFVLIQGAEDLPASVRAYNQFIDPGFDWQFFRVLVRKP